MKKIILLFTILLLAGYDCSSSGDWMLSIYNDGKTEKRIDGYKTEAECLEKGVLFLNEKEGRFDCGYRCKIGDIDNYEDSPRCKKICDLQGCR